MPIQFRCGSCQQLLGIARRKAGKQIDCPTCGQKTLVPEEECVPVVVGATAAMAAPLSAPIPPIRRRIRRPITIFDRVDVDKLLQPPRKPELVVEETPISVAVTEPPPRQVSVTPPAAVTAPVTVEDAIVLQPPEPRAQSPELLAISPELPSQSLELLARPPEPPAVDRQPPAAVEDDPLALAQVPTLRPVRNSTSNLRVALLALAAVLVAVGSFFAGHWVGAHRRLF